MSTWNQSVFETLGFRPMMSENLSRQWFMVKQKQLHSLFSFNFIAVAPNERMYTHIHTLHLTSFLVFSGLCAIRLPSRIGYLFVYAKYPGSKLDFKSCSFVHSSVQQPQHKIVKCVCVFFIVVGKTRNSVNCQYIGVGQPNARTSVGQWGSGIANASLDIFLVRSHTIHR